MGKDEWGEVVPGRGQYIPHPVVSVRGGDIGILKYAFMEMGEPGAVKVYSDGRRMAFEPVDRGKRSASNAFMVTNMGGHSGTVSAKPLIREHDIEPGKRYLLEQDDETGYWVLDPKNEL